MSNINPVGTPSDTPPPMPNRQIEIITGLVREKFALIPPKPSLTQWVFSPFSGNLGERLLKICIIVVGAGIITAAVTLAVDAIKGSQLRQKRNNLIDHIRNTGGLSRFSPKEVSEICRIIEQLPLKTAQERGHFIAIEEFIYDQLLPLEYKKDPLLFQVHHLLVSPQQNMRAFGQLLVKQLLTGEADESLIAVISQNPRVQTALETILLSHLQEAIDYFNFFQKEIEKLTPREFEFFIEMFPVAVIDCPRHSIKLGETDETNHFHTYPTLPESTETTLTFLRTEKGALLQVCKSEAERTSLTKAYDLLIEQVEQSQSTTFSEEQKRILDSFNSIRLRRQLLVFKDLYQEHPSLLPTIQLINAQTFINGAINRIYERGNILTLVTDPANQAVTFDSTKTKRSFNEGVFTALVPIKIVNTVDGETIIDSFTLTASLNLESGLERVTIVNDTSQEIFFEDEGDFRTFLN